MLTLLIVEAQLPTLLQLVRDLMDKHDNAILLTKVGQFYEVSTTGI